MTTLKQYYNLLESLDWYYQFSDDAVVRGKAEQAFIAAEFLSHESLKFRTLFLDFSLYYQSRISGKDNVEKPQAPKED